jgi:hypothetical protein
MIIIVDGDLPDYHTENLTLKHSAIRRIGLPLQPHVPATGKLCIELGRNVAFCSGYNAPILVRCLQETF